MEYCEEYAALLDGYADGELSPREMDRVREHLTRCPGCQAYLDDILAIRAELPAWEDEEIPPDFFDGVMKAVRSTPQRQPVYRTKRFWMQTLAAAACFAVILQAGLYRGRLKGASQLDNAAPAAYSGGGMAAEEELPMEADEAEAFGGAIGGASAFSAASQTPAGAQDTEDAGASEGVEYRIGNSRTEEPAPPAAPEQFGAVGGAEETGDTAAASDAEGKEKRLFAGAVRVTVPSAQAALLEAYEPMIDEENRTCYCLQEEEYTALLQALAEQGPDLAQPLDEPEAVNAVVTAGGAAAAPAETVYYLVYLREEP